MTRRVRAAQFVRVHRALTAVVAGLVVAGGGGVALAAFHATTPVHRPPTAQQADTTVPTATSTDATSATPAPSAVATASATATATPVADNVVQDQRHPATATPYPTKPPGMPQCQDGDFWLQVKPEQSSYSIGSGQVARFDIALTYRGAVECNGYMGSTLPLIRIFDSQGQLVYKDVCGEVCPSFSPEDPVSPGEVMGTTTDKWNETVCTTDQCTHCQFDCPPRQPVGPGTYTVITVAAPYRQSPPVTFQLTP
jgi:hypothetical protein